MSDVIKQPSVDIGEQKSILGKVISYLNTCNTLPRGIKIKLDTMETTSDCMWCSVSSGAVKTREYVYGGYEAQIPFRVYYRHITVSNTEDLVSIQSTIDDIGTWLCTQAENDVLPTLQDGYSAISLDQTSISVLVGKSSDGVLDYCGTFVMKYETEV